MASALIIPSSYLQDGRILRVTTMGRYSAAVATTITLRARLGGIGGTVLTASAAITCAVVTAAIFRVTHIVQVRANGATGSVVALGEYAFAEDAGPSVGAVTNVSAHGFMGSAGASTPAAVVADLTVDQSLALTCQWSVANAGNTLTTHIHFIESLN